MKIALIGSNGKAGHAIVKEALLRGVDITGFSRGDNKHPGIKYVKTDLFNLTTEVLSEFDVVINAFGTWTPETLHLHKVSSEYLSSILSGTNTRLIVVGGAGSLYIDDTLTTQLKDTPDFPADYKPLADAMGEALDLIRTQDDVLWTYISPAAIFDANGKRLGSYETAGEIITFNKEGKSYISYADFAIAVLDEALNPAHNQERISVYSA